MKTTTNYGFLKPEDNEVFDQQAHANVNMDSIDTQIKARADNLAAHSAETVPPSPGSTVLTYTGDQLTKVEEKDGTGAVIKTTNLNYDGNGVLTSTTEIVNGKTTTTTLNRDVSGVLTSVTRSVG